MVLIDSGVVLIYEGSLDMLFLYPGGFRRGGGASAGEQGYIPWFPGGSRRACHVSQLLPSLP